MKMEMLKRFLRDEDGSNAIEYGLIAGIIGLGIIAGALLVHGGLDSLFTRAGSELSNAPP
jgi:pilus assembly protein Flp/PilA